MFIDESTNLVDLGPSLRAFKKDALAGLLTEPRSLPCKYFYDARGSALFDRICDLEEYYLTRTELTIMLSHADDMVNRIGENALLVEYGSGSSMKTRILLDRLTSLAAYVPIDISRKHLLRSVSSLSEAYPSLEILPVCADYTATVRLPRPSKKPGRTIVYFPGSTIGNFEPDEAETFLRTVASVCGPGGGMLIGVDLQKSRSVLEAAYNDSDGVTAEFNKNILARMNREVSSSFDLDSFEHGAVYNPHEGRIEMYLVSRVDQVVRVDGHSISLRSGERIRTEYSYKYTLDGFAGLAAAAGFEVNDVWTDDRKYFSVQYLVVR